MFGQAGGAALDLFGGGGVGAIAGGAALGLGVLAVHVDDIAKQERRADQGDQEHAADQQVDQIDELEDEGRQRFHCCLQGGDPLSDHAGTPRTETRPLVRRWRFDRQRSRTLAVGAVACVSRR